MYSLCIGIRKVMFLYLCKGTQNLKAYTVDYKDEQLQWVVDRIQGVEDKVLNDELPDKEADSLSCRFCPYKSICDKEPNS